MSASLVASVALASLVGSLHCAAMCGPFAAFYAGGEADGSERRLAHFGYHAGRLLAYASLGALAGALGHAIDLAGSWAGHGRVAGALAGGVMMLWAIVLLADHAGLLRRGSRAPRFVPAAPLRWLARLRGQRPIARAALLGLMTTLLPCGWLYAFAVVAAGTGNALGGALVMSAFWAGTVPALLSVSAGVGRLGATFRRHVPVLTALALLGVGMVAVVTRVDVASLALRDSHAALDRAGSAALPTDPLCHPKGATR